jgi:hypothetical protein
MRAEVRLALLAVAAALAAGAAAQCGIDTYNFNGLTVNGCVGRHACARSAGRPALT